MKKPRNPLLRTVAHPLLITKTTTDSGPWSWLLSSFRHPGNRPDADSFDQSILVKERYMETNGTHISGNGSDKAGSVGTATQAAKGMFNEAKGAAQRTAANLRGELSGLKNDLDALVNRAPSLSDDELAQAHRQLMAKFSSVRYAAKGIADQATQQFNRGMETTTEYVKDKPMQSVAFAVGTGLLLGLLFKRR
jgi:ElaB/YqjD/DUF883 family membrane-anchored ribosome-binding protein